MPCLCQGPLLSFVSWCIRWLITVLTVCLFDRIHHPRINEAIECLREAMSALSVQPYHETDSTGELRYVQLTVAHTSPYPAQHDLSAQVQVSGQ